MSNTQSMKLPVWFWVIAGVALVWNLMGVGAYVAQVTMSPEAMAKLSEAERTGYENAPIWATGAFAFAVFGGALGSIFLLLRKKFATPVFGLSLAGIAVQMFHSFFIVNSIAIYGPGAAIMPGMVIVIGIALVWYSNTAAGKGWLK